MADREERERGETGESLGDDVYGRPAGDRIGAPPGGGATTVRDASGAPRAVELGGGMGGGSTLGDYDDRHPDETGPFEPSPDEDDRR